MNPLHRFLLLSLYCLSTIFVAAQPNIPDQILAVGRGSLTLPDNGEECILGTCEGCDFWRKEVYGYGCANYSSCNQVSELDNSSSVTYGPITFSNSSAPGTYHYYVIRTLIEMDAECSERNFGPFEDSSFKITVIDWKWTGTLSNYCDGEDIDIDLTTLISHTDGVTFSGPGVTGSTWSTTDAGIGTHSLTASKDFSNGTRTISLETTIHPLPVVTFSIPSAFCKSDTNPNLNDWVNVEGGSFSHTYGNSLELYGQNNEFIDLTNSIPGSYDINYSYTDTNGCENSSIAQVVIDPLFTIDAGANQEACSKSGLITLVAATSEVNWTCVDCNYIEDGEFNSDEAPPGTYTVRASKTIGACSDTDDKAITIKELPVVEAGPDLITCIDESAFSLTGESPTGGVWTSSCSGCLGGNVFDPSSAGSGTHTITYTYSNAQGCVSSDTRKIAVKALPNAGGISIQSGERCGEGNVELNASLANHLINWYSASSDLLHSGNTFIPSIDVGTTTYYVEAVSEDGCVSESRKGIATTAHAIPDEPVSSDQSRCGPGKVTFQVSGGIENATFHWFENASGGTSIHTGNSYQTPSLATSRSYYVEATSPEGCTGSRKEVQAIINPIPGKPTVFHATNCGPGSVTLSVGGTPAGGSYRWYVDDSTNESFNTSDFWDTPDLAATTSYWVSCVSADGCESPRSKITATILAIPDPPTGIPLARCGLGTVLLSATSNISGDFDWYETEFSMTSIYAGQTLETPILDVSTSYWVSLTDENGCESPRTEVIATVNPIPEPPEVNAVQRCGPGQVTLTASGGIEGATYQWYDNPTGGESLHTGAVFEPEVSVTRNYYVSAISPDHCTSTSRSTASVTINAFPDLPVTFDGERCGEGPVTLHVGGASADGSYRWYETSTGGSSFNSTTSWETPSLTESTSYYVSIVSAEGCEGARALITATIHEVPESPLGVDGNRCGEGVIELSSSAVTPGIFNWYETAFSSSSIYTGEPFSTPVQTKSENYFVSLTDEKGCESPRTEVVATINSIPSAPAVANQERCGEGLVSLSILDSQPELTYRWYDAPTGGGVLVSGEPFSPYVEVTRNYYVDALSAENCQSESRTPVVATIHEFPGLPIVFDAMRCDTGSVILNVGGAVEGGAYRWYENESEETPFNTSENWTTPELTESTSYYVSIISPEGCEGEPSAITATINELPEPPIGISNAHCGQGSVALAATDLEGTINWYETEFSHSSLYQGSTYETEELEASTTYWISVTDGNACESMRSSVIARIDSVPALPLAQDAFRCGPGIVMLAASGGIGEANYSWYDTESAGVPIAEGNEVTFDVSTSRDYYVSATGLAGCEGPKKRVQVTLGAIPGLPVVEGGAICGSGTILLSAGGAPLGGDYRWYQESNRIDTLASGTPYLTGELVNDERYWVSIVSEKGCEGPREMVVAHVNSVPERPFGESTFRCGSGSISLQVSSPVNPPTYNWYYESSGGSSFASGATYTINYLTQSISYWVSVETEAGCESSREKVTAEFRPFVAVEIGPDTVLCINSGKFDLKNEAAIANGIFTGPGIINGEFYPAIAGIGTHLISYNIEDPIGCSADGERIITVISDQSGGQRLNLGEAQQLICLSDDPMDLRLFPNIDHGAWSGEGIFLDTFDPAVAGEGTHLLTYDVAINGCMASGTKEFIVISNPEPPDLASQLFVCLGDTFSIGVKNPDSRLTYHWFLEGEPIGTGNSITHTSVTNQNIQVVAENSFGCQSQPTVVSIEVNEIEVDFTHSRDAIQVAQRVDFRAEVVHADGYYWDFGDGLTSEAKDPAHYYYEPGLFTVSLSVESEDCSAAVIKEDLIQVSDPGVQVILSSEDQLSSDYSIFPNPFTSELFIKVPNHPNRIHIDLIDLGGRNVLSTTKHFNQDITPIILDTRSIRRGVYLLQIDLGHDQKFIKVIKR